MQLLNGIGQAHLRLGQTLFDGHRMLEACLVTTGTTVKVILYTVLTHLPQHIFYLRFFRTLQSPVVRTVSGREIKAVHHIKIIIPLLLIHRLQLLSGIAAYQGTALIVFTAVGHTGTHNTALTAQQLQMLVVYQSLLKLPDSFLEGYPALGGYYIA